MMYHQHKITLNKNHVLKEYIMKRLILSGILILLAVYPKTTYTVVNGATINGAGSAFAASYMDTLIQKYNAIFPCPQFVYKQKPAHLYEGSTNGVNRVLEDTLTFAVSDTPVLSTVIGSTPDCVLQIPFILTSLVIIYRLPNDFSYTSGNSVLRPNATWQGHLNLQPSDLCTIYTDAVGLIWGGASGVLRQGYNGSQTYNTANSTIKAFARSDSAVETGLFVRYLRCAGVCQSFSGASNVTNNQNGPFCNTGAPGQWSTTNVTCVQGEDGVANAVLTADGLDGRPNGAIGYVRKDTAYKYGFIPGSPNGIPLGIAGLYVGAGPISSPANYVQPTNAATHAAAPGCTGGEFLCVTGAYPIVVQEVFVLFATQPDSLTACNIAQFIQFALTHGQKIPGFNPITRDCVTQSLTKIDQIRSAICKPCVEPCNPCLDQTCPLPTCPPCKS